MGFRRRALLTGLALLPASGAISREMSARGAVAVRLRPGGSETLTLEFGAETLVLRCADGAVSLPADRARLAALLPVAGREVAGIAFAADPPGGRREVMALVGWDGARLRLLGLELLVWSGPQGIVLSSRFAGLGGLGGLGGLRIARSAALRPPGLPPHWESWTDRLDWREGGMLTPEPPPGEPGPWQAVLAALRSRAARLLDPACVRLTAADITAWLDGAEPVAAMAPSRVLHTGRAALSLG